MLIVKSNFDWICLTELLLTGWTLPSWEANNAGKSGNNDTAVILDSALHRNYKLTPQPHPGLPWPALDKQNIFCPLGCLVLPFINLTHRTAPEDQRTMYIAHSWFPVWLTDQSERCELLWSLLPALNHKFLLSVSIWEISTWNFKS